MPKVFLETSILFEYMLGKDGEPAFPAFENVRRLFSRARRESWKLYLSDFCVLEGLCAVRKQVTRKLTRGLTEVRNLPEHFRQSIKDEIFKKSREFVDSISQMVEEGSLLLVSYERLNLKETLIEALRILNENFGEIKTYPNGTLDKEGHKTRYHTEYVGLSAMDAFHVTLARDAHCDHFYTTDNDFRPLKSDPQFAAMRIEIVGADTN